MYHFSLWSAREGLPVQCVVSPLSHGTYFMFSSSLTPTGCPSLVDPCSLLRWLCFWNYCLNIDILCYIYLKFTKCVKDTFNITIWLYCYKTALFCFVLYGSSVALIIIISLKYEIRLDNMWYIDVIKDRGCRTKIKYLFSKGL